MLRTVSLRLSLLTKLEDKIEYERSKSNIYLSSHDISPRKGLLVIHRLEHNTLDTLLTAHILSLVLTLDQIVLFEDQHGTARHFAQHLGLFDSTLGSKQVTLALFACLLVCLEELGHLLGQINFAVESLVGERTIYDHIEILGVELEIGLVEVEHSFGVLVTLDFHSRDQKLQNLNIKRTILYKMDR